MRTHARALSLVLLVAGCRGDSGNSRTTDTATSADTTTDDTSADTATATTGDTTQATTTTGDTVPTTADSTPLDTAKETTATLDTSTSEVGDPTTVPLIGDVLSCGTRAEVGGVPHGVDLARQTLDLGAFPDALCNDGSPAVFYYRPYSGAANANKWVIQLKGGGDCKSAAECAQRWCSVLTKFGETQMVDDINDPPLTTVAGLGILNRRDDNPWGNYNHVYVQYCSSDAWRGTARDAVLDTFTPCDPDKPGAKCPNGSACPAAGEPNAGLCVDAPVRFRMHFLGARIVDAVIATLRGDGVAVPAGLPDLDAATNVIFAGASAGGAGVTYHLDRVTALLKEHNDLCQGSSCPLDVSGLIDSIFNPSLEGLDLTHTVECPADAPETCTFDNYLAQSYADEENAPGKLVMESSCVAWHQAHAPGSETRCAETSHIISHHLTTPFFLRMGLVDELLGGTFIKEGVRTAAGDPIDTPLAFATLVHPQLEWFSDWATKAEEASVGAVAPGVFAPGCPKHESLNDDASIFDATIKFQGIGRHFFDVWSLWKAGTSPPVVLVADTPTDSTCQ